MLENFSVEIVYSKYGSNKQYTSYEFENKSYVLRTEASAGSLKMTIEPREKIKLIDVILHIDRTYTDNEKVFVNGYQSWTNSREYSLQDVQRGLRALSSQYPVRKYFELFGDYSFIYYPQKKGVFHSFSYTYVRDDSNVELFGSLSERGGYTVFVHDAPYKKLFIRKETEGLTVNEPYELFDIVYFKGEYDEVFDKYFAAMNIQKPKIDHLAGYTSWYNYYGKISAKQLERDLESISTVTGANIFQIDDGWQSAVGDWTEQNAATFPDGMKSLADKIHDKGLLAGIWLAPFLCAKSSKVAKEHPDWLVRNTQGAKQLGGVAWRGAYILDVYNVHVQHYLKQCFDTILNDWGFDLVKLDFLYASCYNPRHNKTRGTIMCETMDYLRSLVGDKLILGCGVPLAPAFGKVDCCRISSDIAKRYADPWYSFSVGSEIFNTKNVIKNNIFRRHLSGRAFINDPDVFYLRDNDLMGKDEHYNKKGILRFTDEQKNLLATVNNMFGDVLFVSDNIGAYSAETKTALTEYFTKRDIKCLSAEFVTDTEIEIKYLEKEEEKHMKIDLKLGKIL